MSKDKADDNQINQFFSRCIQFVSCCSLVMGDCEPNSPYATESTRAVIKGNNEILMFIDKLQEKMENTPLSYEDLRKIGLETVEFATKILKS